MERNNFEKDISNSLNNFHIVPEQDTWNKIERRIKKEKKTRWGFWIFFTALTLLIVSGAAIYFTQQNSIPNDTKEKSHSGNLAQIDSNHQLKNNREEALDIRGDYEHERSNIQPQQPQQQITTFLSKGGLKILKPNVRNFMRGAKSNVIDSEITDVPADTATMREETAAYHSTPLPSILPIDKKDSSKIDRSKTGLSIEKRVSKRNQPLQIELSLNGGIVTINSTFLSNSNDAGFTNTFTNSNSNVINHYVAYSFKKTISYAFSGSLIKSIGNFALMGGITFKHYLVSSNIHEQYDSSGIITFMKNSTSSNSLNYFGIKTGSRITTGKFLSKPLQFEGGFDLSRCFQRDSASYLMSKKLNVNVNGGVQVVLPVSKSSYLTVGPYLSYGINSISDYPPYNNKHFMVFGLKGSIVFNCVHKPAKGKS